jgi:PST family polysaccharide transporter
MDTAGNAPDGGAPRGFAATAVRGSVWTTAQTVLNKLITVLAGLVLARLLSPAEYGLAFFAAHISVFFFVVPSFVMGDVLLAQPERIDRIAGAAKRVVWIAAFSMFAVLTAAAVPMERWDGRAGLAFLIVVAATRPLADAMLAIPNARMRIALAYRRIAILDGLVMLVMTAGSVAMAVAGAGPVSLTLPPIAALALRGYLYSRSLGARGPQLVDQAEIRPVARRFAVAGLGQYVNNILLSLEVVVLGLMVPEAELGLYVLAATYAVQANMVIATQLGAVLQPIFVHIQHDPGRQVAAFMRATRVLSAVAVPLSLVQAAIAAPVFGLLFQPQWDGAIAVFAILSIGQAFLFVSAPSVALLKAQGRFRTYLILQCVQLMASVVLFVTAVASGGDWAISIAESMRLPVVPEAGGALAMAFASAVAWALFCPIGVWLGGRPARLGAGAIVRMFLEPWIPSVPAAIALVLGWSWLREHLSPGLADVLTLALLAPMLALTSIASCIWIRPDTRADITRILSRFARRGA